MKQELLTEKCNEFMDEVMNLNDLPGLRRQTGEPRRGFRVGAGAAGAKNADEELLRAAFGIK